MRAVALGLFILCAVTYGNALHGPFLIDDYGLFLENPNVQNPQLILSQIFSTAKHMDSGLQPFAIAYFRPVCDILPVLEYSLFRQNVFFYHLFNFLLFYSVCIMIFIVVRQLSKNRDLALLTAALFCVHPMNGLMVNYITAAYLIVQVLSMLLSVWFYSKSLENPSHGRLFMLFSFLFFVLALMCHETAVILPAYLLGISFVRSRGRVITALKESLAFWGILFAYFVFRFCYVSLKSNLLDKISHFDHLNFFVYGASFIKLIGWYVSQIFVMDGIVLIWMTAPETEQLWIPFFVLMFFCAVFIYSVIKFGWRDPRVLSALWFLVGCIPVSLGCFFSPAAGFMIEPHWLFFSSLGIFVLIAYSILAFRPRVKQTLWNVFVIVFVSQLIVTSWSYNRLWSNEEQYCRHWVAQVKGNRAAKFYLANAVMRKGDFVEAKSLFLDSLSNNFLDWQVYGNLGNMAMEEKKYDESKYYFEKALSIKPSSFVIVNNLGVLALRSNDLTLAADYFKKASLLNQYSVEPKLNLGGIYEKQGHPDQARALYEEALSMKPDDDRAMFSLAQNYLAAGDTARALRFAENLLKISHREDVFLGLAGRFANQHQEEMALVYYAKALEINPRNSFACAEMGKIFANSGHWRQAFDIWQVGLKINPKDPVILDLIVQSKQIIKQ